MKSTPTIVPSESLALAVIVTDAGAVKPEPDAGLVIDTDGSWFGAEPTVMLTPAVVRDPPLSSTAFAVSV
jgi:hypothetical protein